MEACREDARPGRARRTRERMPVARPASRGRRPEPGTVRQPDAVERDAPTAGRRAAGEALMGRRILALVLAVAVAACGWRVRGPKRLEAPPAGRRVADRV